MGVLSALIVNSVHYIFPNWKSALSDNTVIALWLYATVQVGLLEESTKLFMFKIGDNYRKRLLDTPVATMFYCMSASMGFAVLENLSYLQLYGKDVLFIRAFTAVVMHLVTGLMMGYMIAKGRTAGNTMAENMSPAWKERVFVLLGLAFATFYHGVYDFNIFLENFPGSNYPIFYVIGPGVVISYLMLRDIAWQKYKKS